MVAVEAGHLGTDACSRLWHGGAPAGAWATDHVHAVVPGRPPAHGNAPGPASGSSSCRGKSSVSGQSGTGGQSPDDGRTAAWRWNVWSRIDDVPPLREPPGLRAEAASSDTCSTRIVRATVSGHAPFVTINPDGHASGIGRRASRAEAAAPPLHAERQGAEPRSATPPRNRRLPPTGPRCPSLPGSASRTTSRYPPGVPAGIRTGPDATPCKFRPDDLRPADGPECGPRPVTAEPVCIRHAVPHPGYAAPA